MSTEQEQRRQAWQSYQDIFFHSDRAAIDLGISSLNAITLLNGGAIVALLAFIGQVWSDGKGANIVKIIIHAGMPFGWGMVAGSISFFSAYFYQSSITQKLHLDLGINYAIQPTDHTHKKAQATYIFWKLCMIISACASVALFMWGVERVSDAFSKF